MYTLNDYYQLNIDNEDYYVDYSVDTSNIINILVSRGEVNAFFYRDENNTIENLKHNLIAFFNSYFKYNLLSYSISRDVVSHNIYDIVNTLNENDVIRFLRGGDFNILDSYMRIANVPNAIDTLIDLLSNESTLLDMFPANYSDMDTCYIISEYFEFWE